MTATPSQVDTALDEVAATIAAQRAVLVKCRQNAASVSATLGALPETFAAVIDTIQNTYGTTNAFEALAKAKLEKLSAEYGALKTAADAIAATNLNG